MSASIQTNSKIGGSLPPPLVPPLNDAEGLAALIGQTTGESAEVVRRRLHDEHRSLGVNVRRELEARGLPFHVWSDDLIDFYGQTDAFVYETCIWNARQLKCAARRWIGEFLQQEHASLKVLSYGDGLGFDSLYLALAGHQVTYFEVSQKCAAFAARIFEQAEVDVAMLDRPEAIAPSGYDVVLCLDVLEHVPDPEELVARFATYLRPGGLLIASAPFYYTTPAVGTHLASNRRYSGDLHRLYGRQGFTLLDGRPFWDPIVLVKGTSGGVRRPTAWLRRALVRSAGWLLRTGRHCNRPHGAIAEWMVRAPADH